ncbi:ABC transporter permease component [Limosilactobacillus coleohominis DSM 14060]|nr:ABC transporter permease component [Limosilactobacillus coleohominis DSM 14060]
MRWSEIDWRWAVLVERNRMATVYRFFNLFTNVPNLQGHIKKRPYLNPLMRWLREDSVWHFLYGRGLMRNTEISDLVLRLTLVMAIILAFVPIIWLNSAIMVLALYLIAVQLMPLYDQYANNAFTYVYPVSAELQTRDFKDVIRKVMIIVAVIMVLASFGTQRSFEQLIINAIIAVIEVPILSTRYVQSRTEKMKK